MDQETLEAPSSMDQTIADSWAQITSDMAPEETAAPEKTRDEMGRFKTGATETPQEAPAETPAAETPETPEKMPDEPKPGKKPPSSWSGAAKASWESLPPHVQDEALRREDDFHRGISAYKEAAEIGQRMRNAYAPYEATIRSLGVEPDRAVAELFKADHILRTAPPAQKAQYFAQLAQQYGVELGQVQQAPEIPPEVKPLHDRLNALEAERQREIQQRREYEAANERREQEALNSVVLKFSQGKEHFSAVESEMLALLPSINQQHPTKSPEEKLQMAYDRAIYANPQVRALVLAKQQQEEAAAKAKKAQEAKKAASVNVPQKGILGAARPQLSMDEQIRADAQRLGLIK